MGDLEEGRASAGARGGVSLGVASLPPGVRRAFPASKFEESSAEGGSGRKAGDAARRGSTGVAGASSVARGSRFRPLDEGDEGCREEAPEVPHTEKVPIGAIDGIVTGRRRVTIDSGAGVSVWPKKFGEDGRPAPGKDRVRLEAANGTEIRQYGNRRVPFRVEGVSRKCEMNFLLTDVVKPLAAVSAIVDAGNEVVFSGQGSYIRNTSTGEVIHLQREKGTYVMEVGVDSVGIMGTESGDEPGFIGQA